MRSLREVVTSSSSVIACSGSKQSCSQGMEISHHCCSPSVGKIGECQCQVPPNLTGRLNQDALENLFATIREMGRYRTNPAATQFGAVFQQVLVYILMLKSDGANCKDDLDSFLIFLKSMKSTSVADTAIISATQRGVPQSVISLPAVLSEQADATTMKDQHIVCYIVGYIAVK